MHVDGDGSMSEKETVISEEEAIKRIHPLRQASVYLLAPLIISDTFLILFTTTLLALDFGVPEWQIGFIPAMYTAVNMPMELFWGWMSDKYGRRPPLIIGSLFTIPALAMFGLATEPGHLFLASAIRGIGGAAGVPISRALAADLAPRKVLGERMGAWAMVRYAAPLIGINVAGFLFTLNPHLPFFTAAGTETASLFLAIFVIPETVVRSRSRAKVKESTGPSRMDQFRQGSKDWFTILRRRGVTIIVFSTLMGLLGSGISTVVFPLWAAELGLPAWHISIVYTVGMLIALVGLVPGGKLSDKIGRKWPALFAGFYGSLSWLLWAFVPGMPNVLGGFILVETVGAVGSVIGGPAMVAYFYEWVNRRERGRASGMSEFFSDLSTTLGLPLATIIYGFLSAVELFYIAAAIGVVAYIVILIIWKDAPPPEELDK